MWIDLVGCHFSLCLLLFLSLSVSLRMETISVRGLQINHLEIFHPIGNSLKVSVKSAHFNLLSLPFASYNKRVVTYINC